MPAENMTITARWKQNTEIYVVKQNADGTWADAVSVSPAGGDAYRVRELYRDEHLHAAAYSLGACADGNARAAIANGELQFSPCFNFLSVNSAVFYVNSSFSKPAYSLIVSISMDLLA